MKMFESVLATVPKNRSELVNEMEIPEVTVSPYIWRDEDNLSFRSDSILSGSIEDCDGKTASSESSLALSRAMTDSEIDYGRYRRMKTRSLSDPWDQMRAVLSAFPPGYLASLNSFQNSSSELSEITPQEAVPRYNDELKLKMERFFEEECQVFTPDDPGLLELEEALQNIGDKNLV